jgi:hypothetical protein
MIGYSVERGAEVGGLSTQLDHNFKTKGELGCSGGVSIEVIEINK